MDPQLCSPVPGITRPADSLAELAAAANSAHEAGEQAVRKGLEHFRVAGDALLKAKAACGHGKWLPWLQQNVKFSGRTARHYMQVAKDWGKLATVANLGLRDALRLLAAEDAGEPVEEAEPENERDDEPVAPVDLEDAPDDDQDGPDDDTEDAPVHEEPGRRKGLTERKPETPAPATANKLPGDSTGLPATALAKLADALDRPVETLEPWLLVADALGLPAVTLGMAVYVIVAAVEEPEKFGDIPAEMGDWADSVYRELKLRRETRAQRLRRRRPVPDTS